MKYVLKVVVFERHKSVIAPVHSIGLRFINNIRGGRTGGHRFFPLYFFLTNILHKRPSSLSHVDRCGDTNFYFTLFYFIPFKSI